MKKQSNCTETETFFDIARRKQAKEDTQCSKEWLSFPAWDDMSEEQKERAVVLAERQGKRCAEILDQYHQSIGVNHV